MSKGGVSGPRPSQDPGQRLARYPDDYSPLVGGAASTSTGPPGPSSCGTGFSDKAFFSPGLRRPDDSYVYMTSEARAAQEARAAEMNHLAESTSSLLLKSGAYGGEKKSVMVQPHDGKKVKATNKPAARKKKEYVSLCRMGPYNNAYNEMNNSS